MLQGLLSSRLLSRLQSRLSRGAEILAFEQSRSRYRMQSAHKLQRELKTNKISPSNYHQKCNFYEIILQIEAQ